MTRTQTLLLSLILTFAVVSCQSSEPASSAAATESTAAKSTATDGTAAKSTATDGTAAEPTATDGSTPASEDVAYEPAYPAEVSSEGLSDDDVSQQETTHSHGDGEHSHSEAEAEDDHQH